MTARTDLLGARAPLAASLGVAREAVIDRRDPDAVFTARFFTGGCGWDWHLAEHSLEAMVLVVSELVTNAVVHAAWPPAEHAVRLRIALAGRRATIEVRDPDPALPAWATGRRWDGAVIDDPDPFAHVTADLAEGGRGLRIVSALTGGDLVAFTGPGGKTVRAALPVGAR